jgi:hypothetical protein
MSRMGELFAGAKRSKLPIGVAKGVGPTSLSSGDPDGVE